MKILIEKKDLEIIQSVLHEYRNPILFLFLEPIHACIDPDDLEFRIMLMEEDLIKGLEHVEKGEFITELNIPTYIQSELKRPLPESIRVVVKVFDTGIEIRNKGRA